MYKPEAETPFIYIYIHNLPVSMDGLDIILADWQRCRQLECRVDYKKPFCCVVL